MDVVSIFSQGAYYLPSLLAHVAAFVVAGVLAPRARLPAGLLAGGTALQLVASCASFGANAWMIATVTSGDGSAVDATVVSATAGLFASVLRAVGEGLVVAAVFVGARGVVAPAAGSADPYGFPER